MTITLGGVTLDDNVKWPDRYEFRKIAQSVRRTLGGGIRVYTQDLSGGLPVTLEAQQDSGWLDKSTVDAIIALADVPGQVYTLNFHGESLEVIFDHGNSPCVSFISLLNREPPLSTDPFYGTIKLLTV